MNKKNRSNYPPTKAISYSMAKDFSFCKYCNTDRGFFQVRKI
uniref:Uncharacterized protein n=1 Tax=Siphoviridae sp. ctFiA6 TaxID=2823573 RepID=A0A8S5LG89_9CAUD|nr:MAG TPA: hypothetical protein [Siphoviridae sp. ctFiA6]